jgi:predicted adenine nucleotide alpha hydrolase (AANH) superfamily ATPase
VLADRILLHICCAPCATSVIRRLQEAGYQVHGYFYNPNIQPEKEYYQRLLEVQRLCKEWSIPLQIGDYDWDRWQACVRGLADQSEGGKRCWACFRYRLAAAAEKAQELEIGAIATTLTISPRKSPDVVNPIGREVSEEPGLKFLEADWKKKDGYKQSLDFSKAMNLYRQNYCGCKYSLREREERVAARAAQETVKLAVPSETELPGKRVTRAMRILAEDMPKPEPAAESGIDTRAKWELSPLERKQKRDKKAKPWQGR